MALVEWLLGGIGWHHFEPPAIIVAMRRMKTGLAILVLTACVSSCKSTIDLPASTPPSAPSDEMTTVEQRAFLVLETGRLVDHEPAKGFFVEGTARDGLFAPQGDIRGEGELGSDGHPGWLELVDASFHGDETGRAPFVPYVRGFMDEDGVFRPASREIQY